MHEDHATWRDFAVATLNLVGGVLGARRLAMYRVDDRAELHTFVRSAVPDAFHAAYLAGIGRQDPLHVRRIASRSEGVTSLAQASAAVPGAVADRYRRFLLRFDTVDSAELLFRRDGRVEAGLSVMWGPADSLPNDAGARRAWDLQRFIEFNLVRALASMNTRSAARAILTAREADVVELVCCGRTNQEIADQIGVRLSTVKTHLIHVFDKLGIESRAALATRMSGRSGSWRQHPPIG